MQIPDQFGNNWVWPWRITIWWPSVTENILVTLTLRVYGMWLGCKNKTKLVGFWLFSTIPKIRNKGGPRPLWIVLLHTELIVQPFFWGSVYSTNIYFKYYSKHFFYAPFSRAKVATIACRHALQKIAIENLTCNLYKIERNVNCKRKETHLMKWSNQTQKWWLTQSQQLKR